MPSQPEDYQFQVDGTKDYPFVPSTEENSRLELQSEAYNDTMLGDFSRAPVQTPKKILDIGCGTGIQTRLLAEKFPEAVVVGIDPNPVPEARNFPRNVRFILGKFEDLVGKHELLQPSTFDLIYQRMLIMVISDWKSHVQRVLSLLRPGGWLESQEIHPFHVYNAEGEVISEDWRFLEVSRRDLHERGFDPLIGEKLPIVFREGGLVDAQLQTFPVVHRPDWKARPETETMGRYVQWQYPSFWRLVIGRAAQGENGEDADELIREFDEKTMNGAVGEHSLFYVTVARKAAE